jgi:membrane dipeptidase
MNRIGMTIDLSHVHNETMHYVLDISKAPIIFSHSSTRALCRHVRDVPDDVLIRLPQNGGVCMIVFAGKFVAGEFWVGEGGKVGATILEVADHIDRIDHIVKIAGIDHVGVGGDYDGASPFARGLEDVSKYPSLTCELLKRGYNEEQLSKLLGLNIIRVLKKCEEISSEMKSDPNKYPIGEAHWGDELYETPLGW